jgi:DNA-binding response OmpR family regulator
MTRRDLTQGESAARILVVAGNEHHARRLLPVLERDGYQIETVLSLALPLPRLTAMPDLAIVWFPYASPDALSELESIVRAIQDLGHRDALPVLLIVDEDGARWVEPSFRLKITDILMRPIHPLILRQRVRLLLRARQSERLVSQLKRQVEHQQRQRMIHALETALQMFQDDAVNGGTKSANSPQVPCPVTISHDLVFDIEEHCLVFRVKNSKGFKKTKLTANQTSILSYMVSNPYRALGYREIARAALGYENIDECQAQSIVRPHILRLRCKLEKDAHHPQILRTVRGSGYIFSPE